MTQHTTWNQNPNLFPTILTKMLASANDLNVKDLNIVNVKVNI